MPSSVINTTTYDVSTHTLRIIFVSGSIYDYMGVPLEIYQAMKQADSKGIYFNQYLKGKYPFKRIK